MQNNMIKKLYENLYFHISNNMEDIEVYSNIPPKPIIPYIFLGKAIIKPLAIKTENIYIVLLDIEIHTDSPSIRDISSVTDKLMKLVQQLDYPELKSIKLENIEQQTGKKSFFQTKLKYKFIIRGM